ncbi:Asp-tRNA(Asn)/Glu-tRNA(Gln) amidotransferase subunit GatC [Acidomonas methanolica]|uniref:Aspartyl/glutamyl-tRNA(Asn/Gln) amidotransferase subunit C n=1 Tax=Acidomonas methanolica NBRC 104435 TaxID=1231351 RepID=A0A023D3B6_ACIMT|nr:Asp-tRNA(Asn)/Glu-tRNA(Gln) amidotransferase subunit GatC [Acidomonas methanolica]MBU2653531.1 Asp-tRNA(Asn)/Glu-tRNA(Gln) amidotransferase subunit GatC [Acidomonas methanolica]TCS31480.1 aspartyl/glutamyl-tRNA(Asn/Gln) amidotransferase subunit C [Acidomonas methanolica]GAJ28296.1 glutamyl-tRNA(Gln) amidotransferase subunit C [Acidomonas methanolica NBRC 104435]GBQ55393.1 glutamyl-tRNA amidotransferase subunit C [Acidomonas methanolica]GEK97901.1 aspartyl/glutamyl-tRNA(Asn/Gln) amidotransfe
MSLDTRTVRRIAKLARIGIDDAEAEGLARELGGILGWVEQLDEVEIAGVPPMIGTGLAAPRAREDVVTDGTVTGGACREAVLSNAPDRVEAFFTVPKVVE